MTAALENTNSHEPAFESGGELRTAHTRLLEEFDAALESGEDLDVEQRALTAMESQIRVFLRRGVATGVCLDEVKERVSCQTLVDYWVSCLARIGKKVERSKLEPFDNEKLPNLDPNLCPYRGLDAFRDPNYFFGRESDTAVLVAQIRARPMVVVLGASGSGKSSLVMGGVLPALAAQAAATKTHILPVYTPGDNLLEHAVAAVSGNDAAALARIKEKESSIVQLFSSLNTQPTIMTVDQFEEIFTLTAERQRTIFIEALIAFLKSNPSHRLILTVREEFRSRIVGLNGMEPFLEGAWYSMRPMNYVELRSAVEKPAALTNLQFQSGIIDDLVKKVLGQPAALPLLQFSLRKLWDLRSRNRVTSDVYRKIGGPLEALKSSADEFYASLAPEIRDEVKRILVTLVRVDELLEAYRQPMKKGMLLKAGRANTRTVIEQLAERDYLRVTPGASEDEDVVEVKHEALVRNWPQLVAWIDEKRIERRQRLVLTETAAQWDAHGRPRERLLGGWQLEETKRYDDLSQLEQELLDASVREKDRSERKKVRILSALLAVLLTIAGGIAIAAIRFRERALELDALNEKLDEVNGELDRRNAQLAAENKNLNSTFRVLGARAIVNVIQEPKPKIEAEIWVHISREEQREPAAHLVEELRNHVTSVREVELVPPRSKSRVSYFHEDSAGVAERIGRILTEYLGVSDVETFHARGFETKVDDQHYEIYFSSEAELETIRIGKPAQRSAYEPPANAPGEPESKKGKLLPPPPNDKPKPK